MNIEGGNFDEKEIRQTIRKKVITMTKEVQLNIENNLVHYLTKKNLSMKI